MQFLLFFISFIAAFSVVHSTVDSSPAAVLKQSAAFLATFADADPNVIGQMINLVKDLEAEGVKDKNDAIANTKNKLDTLNEKKKDLEAKQFALQEATNKQTATKATQDRAAGDEKNKRGLLQIATKNLAASKTTADNKEKSLNEITARVQVEKKAFKKIVELLDSVIVPESFLSVIGRNLLASDEANPDAVKAVKIKVAALDTAADAEVADATKAHNSAQLVLKTDQKIWEKANAEHVSASGALTAATKEYLAAVTAVGLATTANQLAVQVHGAAQLAYNEAVVVRDATLERVANEAISLANALKLLETLLPKSS